MTAPAGWADVPAIRALLGESYADDPLTQWIFRDPATRRDACAAWYGLFAEQYVAGAQATVVRDGPAVVAVALWRSPDDRPLSSAGAPGIGGLLTALAGAEWSATVAGALHEIDTITPDGPHVYLNFLAVAAEHRRAGLGRSVLAPVFAAADAAGLPVRLETTNPANYAFYDALGFVETGRLTLGGDGPVLRALSR